MDTLSQQSCAGPTGTPLDNHPPAYPQLAILDFFFPGITVLTSAFQKYLGIDLNVYVPLLLLCGCATFAWQYFSDYIWGLVESHLMSSVEVRTDDEIYNILMAWVAGQKFAKKSRRFIANTNLNSRAWNLWRWHDDEDDEDDDDQDPSYLYRDPGQKKKKKPLAYTPSFGSHVFWYNGWLLRFRRSQNQQQPGYLSVSEREEISISCFGRNPYILKKLLLEARAEYLKKDSQKTMIYRGGMRAGSTDPTWQRCMARNSRPLSTVILNEKKKMELVEDVADYLSPATRSWYSNRGIPWRRGYLFSGPPGTGKSSLSLALAGFFKMRIYMVSLSSISANEENLATLFADLPQRCVVLLEDIDTAGLTHTREEGTLPANNAAAAAAAAAAASANSADNALQPGQLTPGNGIGIINNPPSSRLSLSGLLNILDGVASQEGRVLMMTTNHVEKLDRALIRPGRVDVIIEFSQADEEIIGAIYKAIFAPLEGEEITKEPPPEEASDASDEATSTPEDEKELAEKLAMKRAEKVARIEELSQEFVKKIPAHEFSPAEIQGFLMKHKRDPEAALAHAEEWVVETRKQKKEKEIKAAEEKRVEEQKKKKEEAEKAAKAAEEEEVKKNSAEKKSEVEGSDAKSEQAKDETTAPSDEKKPGEGEEEDARKDETSPSTKPEKPPLLDTKTEKVKSTGGDGDVDAGQQGPDSGYVTPEEA